MTDHDGDRPIVIFDGSCGFCSSLVTFILRHDKTGELLFSPNSSPYGIDLLNRHKLLQQSAHTIVVVTKDAALTQSDAVALIASNLTFPYSIIRHIRYIPRRIRDLGYRAVAAIRAYLPEASDVCNLLPKEQRTRIKE